MLLDHLVDQLLVFDGQGNVTHFLGTYSEWHDQQTAAAQAPPPTPKPKPKPKKATAPKNSKPQSKPSKPKSGKSTKTGKLSQAKLESEIERLESRLHEIDFALMDPEVFSDGEKVKALQAERAERQEELKPLEREWAERAG